jgi:sugar lactone lactonase YvrE
MPPFAVADIENIATGVPTAEGIAIANDRRIFVGAQAGWIYVISPNGEVSQFAKTPGRPLGTAIDRQGNLSVCDWEAPTGGYLLTFCFASGCTAGTGVLKWLDV